MTPGAILSIVIPAHDEATQIGQLLDHLAPDPGDEQLDILVVCNGCHDDTAEIARAHPARPRVVEIAPASKHEALVAGDQAAHSFPRLYIDADVLLDKTDALALAAALSSPAPMVVAPIRRLDASCSSRAVRRYCRLWEALPAASGGVYGRGVIGVNEPAWSRLRERESVLADDAYVDGLFAPEEKLLVHEAVSTIRLPRTLRDLVRRRIRVAQANAMLHACAGAKRPRTTRIADVTSAVARDPGLLSSLPGFAAVTVVVKIGAAVRQRRGQTGWLSDDSRAAQAAARPS